LQQQARLPLSMTAAIPTPRQPLTARQLATGVVATTAASKEAEEIRTGAKQTEIADTAISLKQMAAAPVHEGGRDGHRRCCSRWSSAAIATCSWRG